MNEFKLHDAHSAPEASGVLLEKAQKAMGFLPNLYAIMAESPTMLSAYLSIGKTFGESSLSPVEQQVVLLVASRINGCEYCVSAHSKIAGMAKMPDDVLSAIRDGSDIADARLQALAVMTNQVVDKRGWLDDADIAAFEAAGFTRAQLLEVIVGVAMKTMSNYVNHIAETPLDAAFADTEWAREA